MKIHKFSSTGEAYDASQTHDDIRDGDVLSVESERAVAVLIEAWPVAISENTGEFHPPGATFDWDSVPTTASDYTETKDYMESFKLAVEELNRICWEAQPDYK